MISFLCAVLVLFQPVMAQIEYDPNSNTLLCSKPGGSYCSEGSLQGPTIISCLSESVMEVRSCNIMLSRFIPPLYSGTAVCYETSKHAGDAICAFNGTGYSITGKINPVPETSLCGTWESPIFAVNERNCDGESKGRHNALQSSRAPYLVSLGTRICSIPYNQIVSCATATTESPLRVVVSDVRYIASVSPAERVSSSGSFSATSVFTPGPTGSLSLSEGSIASVAASASTIASASASATATVAVNVGTGRVGEGLTAVLYALVLMLNSLLLIAVM